MHSFPTSCSICIHCFKWTLKFYIRCCYFWLFFSDQLMTLVWMSGASVVRMCWWCVAVMNACAQARCSHLCLPTLHFPGFTCACPNSHHGITYSLAGNGQTCHSTRGERLRLPMNSSVRQSNCLSACCLFYTNFCPVWAVNKWVSV